LGPRVHYGEKPESPELAGALCERQRDVQITVPKLLEDVRTKKISDVMEKTMSKINWARVFLGGLLTGVIINVFEFVTNGVFLAAEWKAQNPEGAAHLGYAAARPRFGPGVKTAVLTGCAFWVLTTVLRTIDDAGVGLYPPRLLVILVLVCLLQSVVASVAGARVYKE